MTENTIAGLETYKVAERLDYIKALFFGPTGSGKTRLSGSVALVPVMNPALFIDVEGGTKSIRNLYPSVDAIRIQDRIAPDGKVISSGWNDVIRLVESGELVKRYKTVVVDSLTELNKSIMKDVNFKSWAEAPDKRDLDVPSKRDWGKGGERTRWLLRTLRDMPIHVIFTALETLEKAPGSFDEQKGPELTGRVIPQLPGQLATQIPAFLDEVFYLYAKPMQEGPETVVKYFLLAKPDGVHIAKDRSDNMPIVMENPTMDKIAALVLDAPGGDGQRTSTPVAPAPKTTSPTPEPSSSAASATK